VSDGKKFCFLCCLWVVGGFVGLSLGWVLPVGLGHFLYSSFGFGFWVYGVVVYIEEKCVFFRNLSMMALLVEDLL